MPDELLIKRASAAKQRSLLLLTSLEMGDSFAAEEHRTYGQPANDLPYRSDYGATYGPLLTWAPCDSQRVVDS